MACSASLSSADLKAVVTSSVLFFNDHSAPHINNISPSLPKFMLSCDYGGVASILAIALADLLNEKAISSLKAINVITRITQMMASKIAYSLVSKALSSLTNLFSIFFILTLCLTSPWKNISFCEPFEHCGCGKRDIPDLVDRIAEKN